jgi:serine protease inhibitor
MLQTLHIDPENLDKTYGSFAAILTVLKERDGKDGLALNVASRLWIRKDLEPRPAYVSLLRDVFRTRDVKSGVILFMGRMVKPIK